MKQDKLANLFDFLPKSKVKAGAGLDEGKYPFYTSSENQLKYLDAFQHEPGCLVFGTGGKASVHFTTSRFATSTDCITIRPKPKARIDAGYVFHFFKGNMQVLESGFKGAGLKHISKAYLSDIQIPHPEELDDQKRIAHLLGKVEGLIARRKQHLQQLDDLLKSVFLEMFGDPVRNEKRWETGTSSVYAEMVTVGVVVKPASYYVESGVIALRSLNIKPNRIASNDLVYFSQEANDDVLSKSRLQTDDVVVVRTGKTGTAAVVPAHLDGANCIDLIIVRPKRRKIHPQYLTCLLNSERGIALVASREVGGIQKHFNVGALNKIPFPLPPIDLQNRFAAIVKNVEGLRSRYQQSLTDLESLYGALSQKAFKGELDLSRVPLPAESPEIVEDEQPDVAEKKPMEPPFELPAPEELVVLQTAEGRKSLLGEWLNAWLEQLSNAPFTVQKFMEAARQRLWELAEDDAPDWGVAEYDELKAWVFEALEQGRLIQGYDDAINRVQITAAKG